MNRARVESVRGERLSGRQRIKWHDKVKDD